MNETPLHVAMHHSGFADIARRYDVVVNGEIVGHIKNGGTLELPVPTRCQAA